MEHKPGAFSAHRDDAMVALWAAVIVQAIEDLQYEPYASLTFREAESFLLGGGDWARSRQALADCVDMHGDDLRRRAQVLLAERHAKEPPPAREVRPPPPVVVPKPIVVAPTAKPVTLSVPPARSPRVRRLPPAPAPQLPIAKMAAVRRCRSNAWLEAFIASGQRA